MTGSVIKRGDRVYLIRLSLGTDKVTGKRLYHTETVHGVRKEADARCRQLVSDFERGILASRSGKSYNEFLVDWLATAQQRIRDKTHYDYTQLCKRHIQDGIGRLPLDRVSALEIQKLYNGMVGKGLSPLTVRRLHAVVNQSLRQAVRWRMLPHNPAVDVDLPKRIKRKIIRAMTLDQAQSFLLAAKSHRLYALFELAFHTGMRPEEYMALCWSDIDEQACRLRITRVISRPANGSWQFEDPKTDHSRRSVTVDRRIIAILLEHRARVSLMRDQAGANWDGTQPDFVFPNQVGRPLDVCHLGQRHFKKLLEQAGLPKTFRLYDIRHTHATLLLAAGEHPKVVSERLGHASIQLTLDTYSSVLPTMQEGAATKAADLLLGSASATLEGSVVPSLLHFSSGWASAGWSSS